MVQNGVTVGSFINSIGKGSFFILRHYNQSPEILKRKRENLLKSCQFDYKNSKWNRLFSTYLVFTYHTSKRKTIKCISTFDDLFVDMSLFH